MRAVIAGLGSLCGTAAAVFNPVAPPTPVVINGLIYDGLGGVPLSR